jgi:hypothetical protein
MKKYLVHVVYGSLIIGSIAMAPAFGSEGEGPISETVERSVTIIGDPIPGSEFVKSEHVTHEGTLDEEGDRTVEKTSGSFRERFFSIDRPNPYLGQPFTEEEEQILRDNPDLVNQPDSVMNSRIANCDSLANWDSYFECMWKPWKYGF